MAGSAVDNLRVRWEQISQREQRLIIVLAITFVVVLIVWVGLQINKRLAQLDANNKEMRKALAALQLYRATGETQSGPDVPIPKTPIKLQTYLAGIAEEVGITIPNFNQLSPISRDEFTEHGIRIELRNLSIQEVTQFLQKVESNSQVVVVKTLNLKQKFNDREKLDLRVDVATYSLASEGEGDGEDEEAN